MSSQNQRNRARTNNSSHLLINIDFNQTKVGDLTMEGNWCRQWHYSHAINSRYC